MSAEPMSAEEFLDHMLNCGPKPDATIVCDKGVNGDDVIATMLATGLWLLSDEVEYIAGKRIRHLIPVSEATP